jgi:hypothetical protein
LQPRDQRGVLLLSDQFGVERPVDLQDGEIVFKDRAIA